MINNIILQDVATYHSKAILLTDNKKVNLIYGLNGVGKSTLSKYLYNIQDPRYEQCSIELEKGDSLDDYEFLVYNTKFVEENFYEKNAQKGIFTLSKENKKVEEDINLIEKIISEIYDSKIETQTKKDNLTKDFHLIEESIKDSIWKSKLKYFDNDPIIQDIVGKGNGRSIDKYFNLVLNANFDPDSKNVTTIRQEYEALSHNQETIPPISALNMNVEDIEKNPVLQKQIVGSSNSSISELIETLKNTDWVKTGRSYLKILNNKVCPFCQRDGISESFINELENFFDHSYEKDIALLEKLQADLTSVSLKIAEKRSELELFSNKYSFLTKDIEETLWSNISSLQSILESNCTTLQQKIKEPSIAVVLKDSSYCLQNINQLINDLNSNIQEFNTKIDNVDQEKIYLKNDYWKAIHKESKDKLDEYYSKKLDWEQQFIAYEMMLKNLEKENQEQTLQLLEKRKQVANIDDAIESINGKLDEVGLGHLKIVKYQESEDSEQLYRFVRNGEKETDFRSFSEGEKMMISFLYFVERCKGAASSEGNKKKKIVVIDDPISSLSHIFVYNVALIINTEFNNWNRVNSKNEHGAEGFPYPYDQVFILTHNLYFYYELIERNDGRRDTYQKLHRICKKDNNSSIVPLKYNEIHNDYQAYWTIVRDPQQADHPLLANCMRNILEYFFVFAENIDLSKVFSKPELKANKYQAFYRYINRESHSIGQNACDTKEFDYDQILDIFKEIFEVTHYGTHFKTMMKIK